MKIINLWGGPGVGKSTIASDLFALMKWNNMNVELVNEYAKELTWERRYNILKDQLYVFAKQNRKLSRLKDQVDYIITDSPLLMGLAYAGPDQPPSFYKLAHDVWDSYDNINIRLIREKPYHQIGRTQTIEESIGLDKKILNLMIEYKLNYSSVLANEEAKHIIARSIK